MHDLMLLRNILADIIQLLSSIQKKFTVKTEKMELLISKNSEEIQEENINNSARIELTFEHHIQRLKIAYDLLDESSKTENFNLKVNFFNLKKLYFQSESIKNIIYRNADSLHIAMRRINELNTKLLVMAYFKSNEIIFSTRSTTSKEITVEYDFLTIYKKNEELIRALNLCFSDILINFDLVKINEARKKLEPYTQIESISLFNSLINNKEDYELLLNKLIENKKEIYDFQNKQIDFKRIIDQYNTARITLDEQSKKVGDILIQSSENLNTYKDMSSFLYNEYTKIYESKERIGTALNSITEINKVGDDAKQINDFMSGKKKEINEVLENAKNTIKIISGSSIAKHLNTQEKKENKAAIGWLVLSAVFLGFSLYFMLKGYNGKILDWNFIAFKLLTLPITLSALFFSMRQYIRRKTIVDSYAYKKTLALSLTGFKKQIDKTGDDKEKTDYILKTIEILTESPLNSLDKAHIKSELEAIEKMRESVLQNIMSKITEGSDYAKEKSDDSIIKDIVSKFRNEIKNDKEKTNQ